MADAKSRYEIVESLTEKRTDILDQIEARKKSVQTSEAGLQQLARAQKNAFDDFNREQARKTEEAEASVQFTKDTCAEDVTELEKKEVALTEAIDALKSISRHNEKA